jgi:hypothetical protein
VRCIAYEGTRQQDHEAQDQATEVGLLVASMERIFMGRTQNRHLSTTTWLSAESAARDELQKKCMCSSQICPWWFDQSQRDLCSDRIRLKKAIQSTGLNNRRWHTRISTWPDENGPNGYSTVNSEKTIFTES